MFTFTTNKSLRINENTIEHIFNIGKPKLDSNFDDNSLHLKESKIQVQKLESKFSINESYIKDSNIDHISNRGIPKQESNFVGKSLHLKESKTQVQKPESNFNGTFSSCLLFKDDNHRLSEWIAYHYYALPLGYLVIGVDSSTKTQPKIDKYWRKHLNIIILNETQYCDQDHVERCITKENDSSIISYFKHQRRQLLFYQACSIHLKEEGRAWTMFHDVDEFVSISEEFDSNLKSTIKTPGFVEKIIHRYQQNGTSTSFVKRKFLRSCIILSRVLYSSSEDPLLLRNHSFPTWLDKD